ncbi:MAG: ATP-binding protein [Planctomycetaceae bacterium]|nr:ATP-binding protein [Planctomycetaceae bacterium]
MEPGPIAVRSDATRLEQVVANLPANAARSTEPGGRITLSAGREADEAVLRAQVFDAFLQAGNAAGHAPGGQASASGSPDAWSRGTAGPSLPPAQAPAACSSSGFP